LGLEVQCAIDTVPTYLQPACKKKSRSTKRQHALKTDKLSDYAHQLSVILMAVQKCPRKI